MESYEVNLKLTKWDDHRVLCNEDIFLLIREENWIWTLDVEVKPLKQL